MGMSGKYITAQAIGDHYDRYAPPHMEIAEFHVRCRRQEFQHCFLHSEPLPQYQTLMLAEAGVRADTNETTPLGAGYGAVVGKWVFWPLP